LLDMARVIQIRNVPDRLHRTLEARAAQAGMSLSEFLLVEARKIAERPSRQELIERIAQLPPVRLRVRPAAAVRAGREQR
jgi:plasmid stability protein